MCATFRIDFGEDEETLREIARRIEERYGIERAEAIATADRFPKSEAPVVSKEGLGLLQWGYPMVGANKVVFNARRESVLEKPMFRSSVVRRCAVPATAFYEWDHRGGKPLKLRLRLDDRPMFYMAALWNRFRKEDGSPLDAFVLLTTTPNAQIVAFHDRMPCLLTPDALSGWLAADREPAEALASIGPFAGVLRIEAA